MKILRRFGLGFLIQWCGGGGFCRLLPGLLVAIFFIGSFGITELGK